MTRRKPDDAMEKENGYRVIGLDEAGRGPLAGPVVAAAVRIPPEAVPLLAEVDDSKRLTPKKREFLHGLIQDSCHYGIGIVPVALIDRLNILQAAKLAMTLALESMGEKGDPLVLVDGNQTLDIPFRQQAVVKGDSISVSIAAASVLAKVTRDRIMNKLHQEYPAYQWDRNAGYPSAGHLEALERYGVTRHHRTSYAPVRRILSLKEAALNAAE